MAGNWILMALDFIDLESVAGTRVAGLPLRRGWLGRVPLSQSAL